MNAKSQTWTISLITILYVCGIIAIGFNIFKEEILPGSSILLLTSCLAIIFSYKKINTGLLKYMLFAFSVGMITEIIGVQTSLLFGSYAYSSILGPKILGVPLIIGMNWIMLSLIGMAITSRFKIHGFAKVIVVSLIMVFLDFIIEPVAIELNFWQWTDNTSQLAAPISNYIWWFLIALVINTFGFTVFKFDKKNDVAGAIFVLLLLFFVSLYFIL